MFTDLMAQISTGACDSEKESCMDHKHSEIDIDRMDLKVSG